MTPPSVALLATLNDRLIDDHVLRLDTGDVAGLDWVELTGAIEADIGTQTLRVERDCVTITNKAFGSSKRIPLS